MIQGFFHATKQDSSCLINKFLIQLMQQQQLRYQQQKHKTSGQFEMEAFSLTVNISINSWSNLTTKDSFKILRKSWFWNCHQCPWLLDLIKNWQRYWHWQSKRKLPFSNWPLFLSLGVYAEIWHYCIA